MSYILIDKKILRQLQPQEAYVLALLSLKSKRDADEHLYESHLKEETISNMTGYEEHAVSGYLSRLEELGALRIRRDQIPCQKGRCDRNTYFVRIPDAPGDDWFRVDYSFLDPVGQIQARIKKADLYLPDKADKKALKAGTLLKGWLLLLKSVCWRGNNYTLLSQNALAGHLAPGLTQIKRRNLEARRLGLVLTHEKPGKGKTYSIPAETGIIEDTSDYATTLDVYPEGLTDEDRMRKQ